MNITEPNSNHKKFSYKYFLSLSVFLLSSFLAQALSPQLIPEKDTLKVGIAGSEPFVFNDGERGIAIEIWEEMANDNSWTFEYQIYDEVDDALNALNNESIDVLVGPISITAHRLENFRFSQPFYNSSGSIPKSV